MNTNEAIGAKVKKFRTEKDLTLKQVSEESGLSIGFLSQFERGISSIALDSLEILAQILEIPLSVLFADTSSTGSTDPVVHSIDLHPSEISEQIYQSLLVTPGTRRSMLPRIFTLLPFPQPDTAPALYSHDGEEFLYVLEGVVTFYLEDRQYTLYPGDSIHIASTQRHNWMNRTAMTAKILTVNTPNPMPLDTTVASAPLHS